MLTYLPFLFQLLLRSARETSGSFLLFNYHFIPNSVRSRSCLYFPLPLSYLRSTITVFTISAFGPFPSLFPTSLTLKDWFTFYFTHSSERRLPLPFPPHPSNLILQRTGLVPSPTHALHTSSQSHHPAYRRLERHF